MQTGVSRGLDVVNELLRHRQEKYPGGKWFELFNRLPEKRDRTGTEAQPGEHLRLPGISRNLSVLLPSIILRPARRRNRTFLNILSGLHVVDLALASGFLVNRCESTGTSTRKGMLIPLFLWKGNIRVQ